MLFCRDCKCKSSGRGFGYFDSAYVFWNGVTSVVFSAFSALFSSCKLEKCFTQENRSEQYESEEDVPLGRRHEFF